LDNVLFAYRKEYSVQEVKELYCKDENGDFVEELCKEIDDISEIKIGSKDRKYSGAVINYKDDTNNSAGQAFASKG
jgi:restriction endonuclease